MKTIFDAYLGLTFFTSIITTISSFIVTFFILNFFNFQLGHPLTLPFLLALVAGLISFGICYFYPITVASSRATKIDANLPLISNFMSVMASSGISPEAIIRSLSKVGKEFAIDKEINNIIVDIDLRGLDLHSALTNASEKAPSKKFSSLIDGVVTTAHLGGDLTSYLRDQADKYKRARIQKTRKFLDSLAVIAETYVTFMVAAPLMLIVMLSVMSFLGGEVTMMSLDPKVILNLLSFVLIPAGVGILILIVDSMSPTR